MPTLSRLCTVYAQNGVSLRAASRPAVRHPPRCVVAPEEEMRVACVFQSDVARSVRHAIERSHQGLNEWHHEMVGEYTRLGQPTAEAIDVGRASSGGASQKKRCHRYSHARSPPNVWPYLKNQCVTVLVSTRARGAGPVHSVQTKVKCYGTPTVFRLPSGHIEVCRHGSASVVHLLARCRPGRSLEFAVVVVSVNRRVLCRQPQCQNGSAKALFVARRLKRCQL